MNTKVLEYEFQPETVAVVALDDTGRLLIPQVVMYTSIGGHDLGAVCNVVAGSLLCSVWDLCVYQVPSIALDTEVYRAVYGIFRSSSPGEHLFIGYYGVMTIEEEEPPFLYAPPVPRYREEGAGIVPPVEKSKARYRGEGAGIVPPGGLTDEYHNYMEENLSSFLSECCILKPSAQTLRTDVCKAYDAWSTYTENTLLITNRMLTEMLKRRGIEWGGSGGIYFIGLELR